MTAKKLISKHRFFLFVAFPTICSLLYFVGIAEPTYETEIKLIVRENKGGSGSQVPGIASALLGASGSTSMEDAMILEEYLMSADFIDLADEKFDLRAHFASPDSDFIRRLREDARAETFYEFYRDKVTIQTKAESGILMIQARSFSPSLTKKLAEFMVAESENMINKFNDRMVRNQTQLARSELSKAEKKLQKYRQDLLSYQRENAMLDPEVESESRLSNIAKLDSQLTDTRAKLRTKKNYLKEDAFELKVLRQEIDALKSQRKEEMKKLVSRDESSSMARDLQEYKDLKIEQEFALNKYNKALNMVESATLQAAKQEKFLLSIADPFLPEKPVFPRPIRGTLVAFVLSLSLFGVGRLIVATINDHSV